MLVVHPLDPAKNAVLFIQEPENIDMVWKQAASVGKSCRGVHELGCWEVGNKSQLWEELRHSLACGRLGECGWAGYSKAPAWVALYFCCFKMRVTWLITNSKLGRLAWSRQWAPGRHAEPRIWRSPMVHLPRVQRGPVGECGCRSRERSSKRGLFHFGHVQRQYYLTPYLLS